MKRIVGIGTDCVDIARFKNPGEHFLKRVFTGSEIEYCKSKKKQSQHFAGKFAGKEAIIKAMNGIRKKVPMEKIEIMNAESGAPEPRILSKEFSRYKILLTISHTKNIAIAFSMVVEE